MKATALLLSLAMMLLAAPRDAAACSGDCNGDGQVTVSELLIMVNIVLGRQQLSACNAGDANHDGTMVVPEIITAVKSLLDGCAVVPSPTPTVTPTPNSAAATPTFSLASTFPQIETSILVPNCLGVGCHNATDQGGGQVLEPGQAYAALVNVAPQNPTALTRGLLRVAPGDPDRSFLLTKLTLPVAFDFQLGSRMPSGQPPLSPADIESIRAWILRGALPNE